MLRCRLPARARPPLCRRNASPSGRAAVTSACSNMRPAGAEFVVFSLSSFGLSITHNSSCPEPNPKGIQSLSPGLRGTSYPGCHRRKESPTLKGLEHQRGTGAARQKPGPCCNPFRVEQGSGTQPRVARASQPWAGGYNPFGIEKRRADLWAMLGPLEERAGERRPSLSF